ncbi:MAG: Stk1 family PASTA domain-containing Ser/Thr kinase [Firmicutes bacterium]|nr:Stk1 family PASTA domain-containing Ser/Thr kinase [Bacillota bacterium]
MQGKILGGRYEILDKLGTGGMAVVYKARCTWLDRVVTIKLLRDELVNDEEFVRRFRREAQAVARLSHPNIVSVYDVGQEDGVHYIVMEYIEGSTLKELIREEGRLSPEKSLEIALQICAGLEHAHENHIIHRDIKPQNILITNKGRVKVTDFGIALATTGATLTHPGKIMGSVHYLSPEQARGDMVGMASDLYSAGAVLYEMLTGKVPFEGESPISIALKHLQEPIIPPRQIAPSIPEPVEKVVLKSLNKNPAARFKSAKEMAAALKAAARDELPADFIVSDGDSGEDPNWTDGTRAFDKIDEKRLRGKKKRRIRTSFIVAAGLVGVLVAVGLYMLGVRLLVVPEVTVPSVQGKLVNEALTDLQAVGLKGAVASQQYSAEVGKDRVISQSKEANSLAKQGSTVELTVSLGSQMGSIPNVKGKKLPEASIIITNAGYKVGTIEPVITNQVPIDEVISQMPVGDSQAPLGSAVNLIVSGGTGQNEVMTKVVGMKLDLAKGEVARLGAVLGSVAEKESGEYFLGQVMEQDPPQGTMMAQGAIVNLVVSKGPGPIPKNASVVVKVPPTPAKVHEVVIIVDDRKDRREEYRGSHPSGDTINQTVRYYGPARIQVYIDGQEVWSTNK